MSLVFDKTKLIVPKSNWKIR